MRPRLLDLFSGAGGAARGYQLAGFHVTGVDIKPQPRYCGDEFHQADALKYCQEHGHEFDASHASPPCQAHSSVTPETHRGNHIDMIPATRITLNGTGLPWIMENVEGAKPSMIRPVLLCGSMFGLDVRRHRLFESNVFLMFPECQHHIWKPRFRSLDRRQKSLSCVIGNHGHLNYPGEKELRQKAMGIDWMNVKELAQAIPPAFTEYLGRQLMQYVQNSITRRRGDAYG